MKITYIANIRIPTEKAHGRQIMEMCGAFVKQGSNLELIITDRKNDQFKGVAPFVYYGIANKFSIRRIWNIDLTAWQMNKVWGKFGTMLQSSSFALAAFCETVVSDADIIYSRDPHPLFFLSFFKNNLVYEIHKVPNNFLFIYKFLFKRLKKVVVITEKIKDLLVKKLGVDAEKILVVPDGVDVDKFDISPSCHSQCEVPASAGINSSGNLEVEEGAGFRVKSGMTESKPEIKSGMADKEYWREKLNLPKDKKIILYSGHLFRWKGVYILADAAKFLDDNSQIVFLGGMQYDIEKLREHIWKKELSEKITFLGHQDANKIPQYLKAADILVLPNSGEKAISRLYTSPMKMFEYIAARRPIVVSDLPSLREVLDENTAYFFEPDNPQDLADKIKDVLQNKEKSDKIVKSAFSKAQEYSWDKRAEKIVNFF